MKTLLVAAMLLFVDHRTPSVPLLPDWTVVDVWCPPVRAIGKEGAWVTFVVHEGKLHGGAGHMPLHQLNHMRWRLNER